MDHSNMTTGDITNKSMRQGLEKAIKNGEELLKQAYKPMAQPMYVVSPKMYKQMEDAGQIKDGYLVE